MVVACDRYPWSDLYMLFQVFSKVTGFILYEREAALADKQIKPPPQPTGLS